MIGLDLGGTAIKAGLCRLNGELIGKWEGPTEAAKGTDQIVSNMVAYAEELLKQHQMSWNELKGIGVGVAGFVDHDAGMIKTSPNLGIERVPIRQLLEERVNLPVSIDNDANAAALGEAWAGAGTGKKQVVCYTLGTGVGGGIIADGRIYRGKGYAGELGHLQIVPDLEAVSCRCGQKGCLETVSSATGIKRMAIEAVERGEQSELQFIEKEELSAKHVFDAARGGDKTALRIVKRAAYYLGKSMALISVVLHPERFIVGGGVSLAGDVLFEPLRKSYEEHVLNVFEGSADIVPAVLGNDAGMIGASLLTDIK